VETALVALGPVIFFGVPALLVALLLVYVWPATKPVAFGVLILTLSALMARNAVILWLNRRVVGEIMRRSRAPKNQPGNGSGAA